MIHRLLLFVPPKAKDARKQFGLLLEANRCSNAAEMFHLAKSKKNKLCSFDPYWSVEHGLLNMLSGPGAEERAKSYLRSCMPTKDKHKDCAEVLATLQAFTVHDGFKYLPSAAQANCKFCIKLLSAIETSTVCQLKLTNISAFCLEMWQLCAFFVFTTGLSPASTSLRITVASQL